MAMEAETLLAASGWLPEPLRTPGRAGGQEEATMVAGAIVEESAEIGSTRDMAEGDGSDDVGTERDTAVETAAE